MSHQHFFGRGRGGRGDLHQQPQGRGGRGRGRGQGRGGMMMPMPTTAYPTSPQQPQHQQYATGGAFGGGGGMMGSMGGMAYGAHSSPPGGYSYPAGYQPYGAPSAPGMMGGGMMMGGGYQPQQQMMSMGMGSMPMQQMGGGGDGGGPGSMQMGLGGDMMMMQPQQPMQQIMSQPQQQQQPMSHQQLGGMYGSSSSPSMPMSSTLMSAGSGSMPMMPESAASAASAAAPIIGHGAGRGSYGHAQQQQHHHHQPMSTQQPLLPTTGRRAGRGRGAISHHSHPSSPPSVASVTSVPSDVVHELKYPCGGCGMRPIIGTRYSTTSNLSFCRSCFEKRASLGCAHRRWVPYTSPGRRGRQVQQTVNEELNLRDMWAACRKLPEHGVFCSGGCGKKICGRRYWCRTLSRRPDYSLCESCFAKRNFNLRMRGHDWDVLGVCCEAGTQKRVVDKVMEKARPVPPFFAYPKTVVPDDVPKEGRAPPATTDIPKSEEVENSESGGTTTTFAPYTLPAVEHDLRYPCGGCGMRPIVGTRYRSAQLSFCQACFDNRSHLGAESRKWTIFKDTRRSSGTVDEHLSIHALWDRCGKRPEHGIYCAGRCGKRIYGRRYEALGVVVRGGKGSALCEFCFQGRNFEKRMRGHDWEVYGESGTDNKDALVGRVLEKARPVPPFFFHTKTVVPVDVPRTGRRGREDGSSVASVVAKKPVVAPSSSSVAAVVVSSSVVAAAAAAAAAQPSTVNVSRAAGSRRKVPIQSVVPSSSSPFSVSPARPDAVIPATTTTTKTGPPTTTTVITTASAVALSPAADIPSFQLRRPQASVHSHLETSSPTSTVADAASSSVLLVDSPPVVSDAKPSIEEEENPKDTFAAVFPVPPAAASPPSASSSSSLIHIGKETDDDAAATAVLLEEADAREQRGGSLPEEGQTTASGVVYSDRERAVLEKMLTTSSSSFRALESLSLENLLAVGDESELLPHFAMNKDLFQISFSEIELTKPIGSGGSGCTVFLAKWLRNPVAFKVFQTKDLLDEEDFTEFEKELRIHSSLSHPHILRFFGATLIPPRFGIVMEYAEHGDVRQFVLRQKRRKTPVSFLDRLRILRDVGSALTFLHQRKLIHRDLKCQNVLLTGSAPSAMVAKLMDFGLSRTIGTLMTQRVGTSVYMAPEVTFSQSYTSAVDVYSFAIMMHCLLFQNFCPYGRGPAVINIEFRVAQDENCRPAVDADRVREMAEEVDREQGLEWYTGLMVDCWAHEPGERPPCSEIVEVLDTHLDRLKLTGLL